MTAEGKPTAHLDTAYANEAPGSMHASGSTATPATAIVPAQIATDLRLGDLTRALAAGWRDFLVKPAYGLFFAAFYVLGGLAVLYGLFTLGRVWWLAPAMAGFPLFAPFSAVGLYEVSRRREAGLPINWSSVLGALRGHGNDQIIMMGGIVFIAFAIWMGLAHSIFAIFMGESGVGANSAHMLLSPQAMLMLLVGSTIGGLFALALYAITVISLPFLVDRDVDFITAIIVSLSAIKNNRRIMLVWAVIIAVGLALAMIPFFLGLFIVLPVLGHATWHLYRRLVQV